MVWKRIAAATFLTFSLFTYSAFAEPVSGRVLIAPRYGGHQSDDGLLVRVNRNALRSQKFLVWFGANSNLVVRSGPRSSFRSGLAKVLSARAEQGRGEYLVSFLPDSRRAIFRGLFRTFDDGLTFDTLEITFVGRRSFLKLVDTSQKRVCSGAVEPIVGGVPTVAPIPLQSSASNRVDIAMFYSPKSAKRVGGMSGMIVESALLIRQSNDAFERSQIDLELSLVHLAQSLNEENGDISGDLAKVQDGSDGFFDEFLTTRESVGADVVVFVQEHASDTACGLAYQLVDPAFTYESFAMAILSRSCLADLVMAHEVGHILGANHDADNVQTDGAYSFSRGLRFQIGSGATVRTIMAYEPGTKIGYFSNPDITYEGVATGNSSADNASAINLLAATVASYRTLAIPTPTPYTPTSIQPSFAKVNSAEFVSKSKCKVTATFFDQDVEGLSGVAASVTAFNTGISSSPIKFSNSNGKVNFTFKPGKQKKFYVSILDFDTRTKIFKCKSP